MSIRLDAKSDNLLTTQALGLGTSDYTFACWVRLASDLNDYQTFFGLSTADVVNGTCLQTIADGTTSDLVILGVIDLSGSTLSLTTWYWIVGGRESGTFKLRLFDDSTSTTPIGTWTYTTSKDYSGALDLTKIFIGDDPSAGSYAADAEIANAKIHTGVYWTDAQCRTESQKFGIQTAGGTLRYCWGLETIDASTYGINEILGSGPNLSNSGVTNGSTRPSQLEAVPSGGGTVISTGQLVPFRYLTTGALPSVGQLVPLP